jgi:hypothetical protein
MPTAFNQLSRANSTKDLTGNIPPRRNTGGQFWMSLDNCQATWPAHWQIIKGFLHSSVAVPID